MAKITCPYCFQRCPAEDIAFRCINPDARLCPPVADHGLGQYRRMLTDPLLPRVFVPPRRGRSGKATCTCGMITTKAVCPECHNDLPSQYAETESRTIALIGAKEAGKSHYIAVLIHELENRIGARFNASLTTADEQTRRRYAEDFRRYLYVDRVTIPPTSSARAVGSVRVPLIYRLSFRPNGWFGGGVRVTTLVFFDTAGEDLTHIDLMSTETRYLANSSGLIFLLDPLQIPAVRAQVASHLLLPAENTSPLDIIARVAQLMRESNGLKVTERLKPPVALAFSKVDALRGIVDEGSPIHRASDHDGRFDTESALGTHESMRSYVHEWVGAGLDTFMLHNFQDYSYFGVSALGAPPDEQGRLHLGVAPFRVEDPFLWILYRLGIVPGGKARGR